MHTHTAMRRGMPEKVGSSAIFWATPTVKGLRKPAEKPMAAPKVIMAMPTMAS